MGLDDEEWAVVVVCGHFISANGIGHFKMVFSIPSDLWDDVILTHWEEVGCYQFLN